MVNPVSRPAAVVADQVGTGPRAMSKIASSAQVIAA
jgi:hypothetical protein